MIKILKEMLRPFDYLILVAAVILFAHFDYSNLQTIDIIYIITFVIWFLLLIGRVYIIYRGRNDK